MYRGEKMRYLFVFFTFAFRPAAAPFRAPLTKLPNCPLNLACFLKTDRKSSKKFFWFPKNFFSYKKI